MTDYTTILGKGKENAIESRILMAMLGFDSIRSLQSDISKARADGQLILSSTKGGYYLPKNNDEVEEFIATLSKRAKSTFYALKSARAYLNKNENQMSLDDMEVFDYDI